MFLVRFGAFVLEDWDFIRLTQKLELVKYDIKAIYRKVGVTI